MPRMVILPDWCAGCATAGSRLQYDVKRRLGSAAGPREAIRTHSPTVRTGKALSLILTRPLHIASSPSSQCGATMSAIAFFTFWLVDYLPIGKESESRPCESDRAR